jgi:hypothetical protein
MLSKHREKRRKRTSNNANPSELLSKPTHDVFPSSNSPPEKLLPDTLSSQMALEERSELLTFSDGVERRGGRAGLKSLGKSGKMGCSEEKEGGSGERWGRDEEVELGGEICRPSSKGRQ